MIKRIRRVIQEVDHFGVSFQLKFQPDIEQFKSFQGGVATIIIYIIALSYFLYLFIAWQTNQFIPKITTTTIFRAEGNDIQLDYPPYRLNAAADEYDVWEHFNGSKNLFESKSILYQDGNLLQFDKEAPNCDFPEFKQHSIALLPFFCMEKKQEFKMKVQQRPENTSADSYYALEMHQCKNDEKCISPEEFEEFISNHRAYAQIEVLNKFYDHRTQQFQTIPNDYWLLINKELTIYFTMKLKITELEIDDGIMFPNLSNYKYVSKVEVIMQGTSWKTQNDPYVLAEVSVDRETQVIQIQYIKFSELLAQFSSIFSMLLVSGILFNYYNSIQMKKLYFEEVGQVYYKNFNWKKQKIELSNEKTKQSKVSTNCFKPNNEKQVEEELYRKIKKQLLKKSSFIQILNEISKLQLAIALIVPKQKLEKIINMKFNLQNGFQELEQFIDHEQFFILQNMYQFDKEQNEKEDLIYSSKEKDLISLKQNEENLAIQISSKSRDQFIQ